MIDFGSDKKTQSYDAFLDTAAADITSYWTENFPAQYDLPFEPVAGIYAMYPARTDPPQSCEGPITYADVEGNAFYTDCGDIIVYDDATLIPDLAENYGMSAVAVVAAHEYGHAIQRRAGLFDRGLATIDLEQQADCFAGAWTAHVARGESTALQFGDADIRSGLLAMIEVRDPVGLVPDATNNAHGTAFDRVGAFQEGFNLGVARCVEFPTKPNPRVDLQFLTQAEYDSGGNLPYDQILEALPVALDTFWLPMMESRGVAFRSPTLVPVARGGPFPACDGRTGPELVGTATYCAATNAIVYDDAFVRKLYRQGGDLAFSYPIANAYSDAVQTAFSWPLTGESRVLLSDCLIGVWITDIIPTVDATGRIVPANPNQQISLSPGDLDEAVVTAIALGDDTSDTNLVGTGFDKIDAIRDGVLGGMSACEARLS